MTDNIRYQTAKACAGEAIEALYSVYWADSFDAEGLESRLDETIHSFTQNAQGLAEHHPNLKGLEQGDRDAIALSLPTASTQAGGL